MIFNPWAVLGVHRGTPDTEVQAEYRRLARLHHPDKTGGDSTEFVRVTEAWQALRTPMGRQKHLSVISTLGDPCPTCDAAGFTRRSKNFTTVIRTGCATCQGCGYIERKPRR